MSLCAGVDTLGTSRYPWDNMPRLPNSHTAYWLDMRGALSGYHTDEKEPEPRKDRGEDWEMHLPAEAVVIKEDLTGWRTRLDGGEGSRCILAWRDRQGFRWERIVGLNDYVSQADAAQLLGVPLMRVNRWVRPGGPLKSKQRNGYSVIRVRDVYELAVGLGLEVPRGRPLAIIGTGKFEDEDEEKTESSKSRPSKGQKGKRTT